MASRRKRGSVALRHQLWLVLPLSDVTALSMLCRKVRQFGDVRKLESVYELTSKRPLWVSSSRSGQV